MSNPCPFQPPAVAPQAEGGRYVFVLRGFPWYPGAVEGGEAVQEELADTIDVPTGEVFTGGIVGLDGLQNDSLSTV